MSWPRFRAVADRAVLVEFGDTIDPVVHGQVLRLDRLLAARGVAGMVEVTPAYAGALVQFDPLVTDHAAVILAVQAVLEMPEEAVSQVRRHRIGVCYDADLGTDLGAVAAMKGMSEEAVIAAHLGAEYRVYLYGFAPGYAYLAGVPEALHLPRKPAAVRDIPAGRVIIAGPQCIVTTLKMPTGWWIIGASPDRILREGPPSADESPFRFGVGDVVTFQRMSRAEYDAV